MHGLRARASAGGPAEPPMWAVPEGRIMSLKTFPRIAAGSNLMRSAQKLRL